MSQSTDYDNEYWTEATMLKQQAVLRNIIFNPEQFPRANLDAIGNNLEELEFAMLRRFPTVRVLQALTSAEVAP